MAGIDEDANHLSNEQMVALLRDAEQRLRTKQSTTELKRNASVPNKSMRLSEHNLPKPYVSTQSGFAKLDPSWVRSGEDYKLAGRVLKVEDPVVVKERKLEEKKATAGPQWFNLPRTDLTPDLKRDLQLLKMRETLDPKRHYKKEESRTLVPEYSQVGTVIEGPTEFFSARIENKKRKKTLVEEVMEVERETKRFKRKYNEIQSKKTSGKKAFYQKVKEQRRKKSGKI